jgi:predicted LPLAT superfamily acyltransferase
LGSLGSWLFGILAAFLLISGLARLALQGYRRRGARRAAPWWAVAATDLALGAVVLVVLVLPRGPWVRGGALLALLALVTLVLIRYRRV